MTAWAIRRRTAWSDSRTGKLTTATCRTLGQTTFETKDRAVGRGRPAAGMTIGVGMPGEDIPGDSGQTTAGALHKLAG